MSGRRYQRWDRSQIRQHQLLVTSVLLLGLTGVPQRYADTKPAQIVASLFGGAQTMVAIHRVGGIMLLVCMLWHASYLIGRYRQGTFRPSTLPRLRDLTDAWHLALYLVGLRPTEPHYERYSFLEKFDYWAATGGSCLMISTGFVLWFKDIAHRLFGAQAYDVAFHLHSLESVLALIFLLVGHVYHVHLAGGIKPFNMVWLTGQMSRDEMHEHHPAELERLDAAGRGGDTNGDGPISTR